MTNINPLVELSLVTLETVALHPRSHDLTNQRFHKLIAIAPAPIPDTVNNSHTHWHCHCDCGAWKVVDSNHLRRGNVKSCGCHRVQQMTDLVKTHGQSHRPEYSNWCSMKQRCHNPSNPKFADYGGRGIFVCDEWRHDFPAFYDHIGPKPSPEHSVDRINNALGYEPGNVRWATPIEQANNRRPARPRQFIKAT